MSALWWAAFSLAFSLPALAHRADDAWDYDEGPLLQAAALARDGHRLYAEVSLNKPPVLIWLIELGFSLGGVSLSAARMAVLAVTLVGFLSLGALASRMFGARAGRCTMALLLCAEQLVPRAGVVMPDLPAIGLVAAALLAAEVYARAPTRWGWLLSAVAYTAAVGMHPLVAASALPIAALVASAPSLKTRQKIGVLLQYAALVLALAALMILPYDRAGMLRWMVRYNLAIRRSGTELTEAGPVLIGRYLRAHWPYPSLAALSAVALGLSRETRRAAAVVALWFAAVAVTLSLWKPLWDNYFLWVLVPLAVLAGGGCGRALAVAWDASARRSARAAAALSVAAVFAGLGVSALGRHDWRGRSEETRAVVRDLQRVTSPGEFVASDDPFVVFEAGRREPPPLADTSHKSIVTGYLRSEEALAVLRRYHVRVVLLGTGRFERMEPFVRAMRAAAIDTRVIGDHERMVIDPARLL